MSNHQPPIPPHATFRQWARAAGLKPTPELMQFARWAADWGAGETLKKQQP